MLEMLGLILFSVVIYTFLVIVPILVEKLASEDFKNSYFSHLVSAKINSYGK